jgi:hypothetical protein
LAKLRGGQGEGLRIKCEKMGDERYNGGKAEGVKRGLTSVSQELDERTGNKRRDCTRNFGLAS